MQHPPGSDFHRSTLWRRKRKGSERAGGRGRKRVDPEEEARILDFAAGILDRLDSVGFVHVHELSSCQRIGTDGAVDLGNLEAKLLQGKASTVERFRKSGLPPKLILYCLARRVCVRGEYYPEVPDRQPGEGMIDAQRRHKMEREVTLPADRVSDRRPGPDPAFGEDSLPVSRVREFRDFGLNRKICCHLKKHRRRAEAERLIGELFPVDVERSPVWRHRRVERILNEGAAGSTEEG